MPHFQHLSTTFLRVGRHRISDLVESIVRYCPKHGRMLSSRQSAAFTRYRTKVIYDLDNRGKYQYGDIILAYFKLFDELFFQGRLGSICKLKFEHQRPGDASLLGHTDILITSDCGNGHYKLKHCNILLFDRKHDYRRPRERLLDCLGTLLHEMCHAFIGIWGCTDTMCKTKIENRGKRGHGFAWQDIAYSVERACRDPGFLGLSLDLGRWQSLEKELKVSGATHPIDLGRWGFPPRNRYEK